MSKYFPKSEFKWIDPKNFDSYKYSSNSSEGCILEVNLGYPEKLHKLHDGYPLARDKIEIEKEMLSSYQFNIVGFYNIPTDTIKNWCRTFLMKKSMCFIMKTCSFV